MTLRPNVAWAEVTIDSSDPARAAKFWSELLDLPARAQQFEGWFQFGPNCQRWTGHQHPAGPRGEGRKARVHLELWVDNLRATVVLGGSHRHAVPEWTLTRYRRLPRVER